MTRISLVDPPEDVDMKHWNITRAVAASPAVVKGFSRLAKAMNQHTELPARTREAAILRVGALLGSEYEWRRHVLLGREAGLSDTEIASIKRGTFDAPSEGERLAVHYADAVENCSVTDEIVNELKSIFSESQIVELTMLCAMYGLVSRFLRALDIDLDDDIRNLMVP